LALELMALGGWLVSDDQTKLHVADDILVATAPAQLAGLIEWRGVGLLPAATIDQARVVVWLDMTKRAAERMPPRRWTTCLGLQVPLLHMPDSPAVAAGLRHYIMSGAWHSPAEDER
jgi:HPr kinase/phosphorylase